MDKETLYDLRSLLALYPYFQTARLLLLQNLYLLHDPSFDEELRRSAVYVTDREVVFNLVEAAHYKLRQPETGKDGKKAETAEGGGANRTISLIDRFLDSIPAGEDGGGEAKEGRKRRKPTPADAAIDYVAYLLETEGGLEDDGPAMRGQDLIDNFINNDKGKIELKEKENSLKALYDEWEELSLKIEEIK